MNTTDFVGRNEVVANITDGRPVKSYRKTILGKVLLRIWDSMTNTEREVIFQGIPGQESSIFDVFSDWERVYFERLNRKLFEDGSVIEYKRPQVTEPAPKTYEQYSDDELATVINSKWMSLTATLNKINSVAVLFRLKNLAIDMEKSEKVVKVIEARLAEVQAAEYPKATDNSVAP